ncbi:cytotoxic necrotizing factor Rho-activating domain-containing protein [Paraburkholderia sp. SARCC-3016]|uniref:cytotoxic necrotizing factor Rho-activating domain-containing protein n=1 Tax=Paraburkholderia sp. SARCC-3016 TaxID=3058611 RepID=UPI0028072CDE|nr:cytotoxic necrotizing factor Rho-activating domain-containing protein [Paraburkholderia sp. SARCC-3016]MDQ7977083.1 cytotoxic necrotizing factor Rho-activating domain-containing protein [Paraburkholderia sp. SARCC-3016]
MWIQEKILGTSQSAGDSSYLPPAARAVPVSRVVEPPARAVPAADSGDTDQRALEAYPNAVQMAPRLLLLEEHARAIQRNEDAGAELSIEDGEVLKLYDVLRERLAFLREEPANSKGPPAASARVADPPARRDGSNGREKTTQPAGEAEPRSEPPKVEYIGGVRIKTDYSLKDVVGTTANALKSPFASFISSAKDLVSKAVHGDALSAEEEEQIYRYAGIVDAAAAVSKTGNISQLAGSVLDSVNRMISGEPVDKERLSSDLTGAYKVVDTKQARAKPGSRASGDAAASPGGRTLLLPPARYDSRPKYEPIYAFDFPRFRIPLPVSETQPGVPHIVRKNTFKPPTRLPSGRIGYPLSPTRPPHLPEGGTDEAAAGPRRASTDETGGARPRVPARAESSSAGSCTGCTGLAVPKPPQRAFNDLKRIAGRGPISLEVPANAYQDRMRVDDFHTRFYFYRNDRDVTDMEMARPLRKTDYDERRDVLLVGSAEHVTSYVASAKINAGKSWGGNTNMNLQGAEIIELGNGRQGVGAIRLPFANLRRGSTIVVSGGAMNGCTMLFASEGTSLYAYHAGTAESSPDWLTAQQGAKSIVDAHVKIGPTKQREYKWSGDNTDLVLVARQYPFSALVYSGRSMDNTQALVGAGATLGAVGGAADASANAYLHVPRHEFGPASGPRWHMMTFNYHEYDPKLRTIGTAEAVVSKDLKGAVTVSVLAEKGTLDGGSPAGGRGSPIRYRYKTKDRERATYAVPGPLPDDSDTAQPPV